jgi:hypothetical protein
LVIVVAEDTRESPEASIGVQWYLEILPKKAGWKRHWSKHKMQNYIRIADKPST